MTGQRYRHRVTFQEKIETTSSSTGARSHTWSTAWLDSDTELADIPAEVLTGPGREPIAEGAKFAETAARIQLRWFPGLDPAWRILHDDRVFDIVSVETDRTERYEYRLRVRQGLSDGA